MEETTASQVWLSIKKAAEITGLSEYVVTNLVKAGELEGRMIGGRRFVHADSLTRFNQVSA